MNSYPTSFPFVTVSGTPFERGRQYGAAVPERVKKSVALYGDQLAKLGYSAAEKTRLIEEFAGEIANFGAHYIEEMRGIAEGAGVAFDDIVMIDRPLLCSRSSVLRDMWPISHVVRSVDVDCVAEALVSLAQNPDLLGLRDADRRQATEWNSYPRVAARHVVIIEQMLGRKHDNRRAA